MTRTVVNLLLVTLLLLTLLRTLVLAHGNLHEHERQLDHGIDANLEDEPRTQTNLSFLKLFESTNSRPMCRQKGECIKLGGSCQEKGSCPHTHIESRGCAPECSCCLPISTTEECAQENGFCVETGDSCNGTIKILDTSCEDYCTCCLPVPTPDQCSEKNGSCLVNGDRCNGRIKILHNSWEDHCTCCLPVSTTEKCADKNGFCLESGDRCNGTIKILDTSCEEHYTCCLPVPTPDQCSEINGFCLENGDRCNGTINIVHNTMEDHCSCCVPDQTTVAPQTCIGCPVIAFTSTSVPPTCPDCSVAACTPTPPFTTNDDCVSVGGTRIGSQCLTFSTEKLNWDDAVEACASNSGHLATFSHHSTDPNEVSLTVRTKYGGNYFWVGGTDTAQEGRWMWLNEEPFSDQFPWGYGQPDGGAGQNCLAVAHVSFTDDPCSMKCRYICELGPSNQNTEVNFLTVGGTAKATSTWEENGRYIPLRGFAQPGYNWCSTAIELPQSIWYEFPQALRVVKYSFRSRTDSRAPETSTSPSSYVFWGSNNECSKSEGRITLVEDTSDTPFTNENIPKVVDVENPQSYRCYGFTITKTPGRIYPWTCVSEIRFFYNKD